MDALMNRLVLITALITALAAPLAHAQVKVEYVEPEKFTDIGRAQWDRDDTLRGLTRVFETLAKKYVPAGQEISFQVTDVDLAGWEKPGFRHPDVRVVRGVDWPAMSFRYTVTQGGQTVMQGQERLADLNFQHRIGMARYANEQFAYEQRMLEDWFRTKFTVQAAKAQ
jgi:hypothetical protein